MDRVRNHRGLGELLHAVSGAAVAAACADALRRAAGRQLVPGFRRRADSHDATLPLAAGGGRAPDDAGWSGSLVRHPGTVRAVTARDRCADLRRSRRARGIRHTALRKIQRPGCHRSVVADTARACIGPGFPARRRPVERATRAAPRSRRGGRSHLRAALGPLHRLGNRSIAGRIGRMAETCRRSRADPAHRTWCAQLRRRGEPRERASHHPRARGVVRSARRHASVRRTDMGGAAAQRPGAARCSRHRRGQGGCFRGNHRTPAADADGELRAHSGSHILRFPAGIPQPVRALDDDDSLAVRDPVGVRGDAPDGHTAQYRHHSDRIHRPRRDRERSDPFFLPFSGRSLHGHHQRRPATRPPPPPRCVTP